MTESVVCSFDEWFIAEVEEGIMSAEREPLVDHGTVMAQAREIIERATQRHAFPEIGKSWETRGNV